jgi:ABC-type polysaccharide/polyol phosphate export permease
MVITGFWRSWYYLYTVGLRAVMLVSSVLYVMDLSPLQIRNIAVYNPLAHAITWFRSTYFYNYPAALLDLNYLLTVVATTMGFAVVFELATRRYRRTQ